MSLKAKIEAVIYGSEEPVTLAQLVGLMGEEAQAELNRADSAQTSLSLNETEEDLEEAAEIDPSLAEGSSGKPASGEAEQAQPEEEMQASDARQEASAVDDGADSGDAVEVTGEVDSAESLVATADPAAAARAERARVARLRGHFRAVMDGLIREYATPERGLEIREVAGGFRFATKPEYHDAVRGFVRSLKPPLKLTIQALETLAVVAYKQPVTAPEISEIRGVDSGGVLGSLMARKLITTAGRKQVIGRPILYKTSKEFLLKFGLKDLSELPGIEEFERMAGQMAEQEEIPMPDAADPRPDIGADVERTAETVEPERDAYSPQADGESAPADNLEGAPADKAGVDGRLSSIPPDYAAADAQDDPSAKEAEIQAGEG